MSHHWICHSVHSIVERCAFKQILIRGSCLGTQKPRQAEYLLFRMTSAACKRWASPQGPVWGTLLSRLRCTFSLLQFSYDNVKQWLLSIYLVGKANVRLTCNFAHDRLAYESGVAQAGLEETCYWLDLCFYFCKEECHFRFNG